MSTSGFIVRVQPQACFVYAPEVKQAKALVLERLRRADLPAPLGWLALQTRRAEKLRPQDLTVPYLVPARVPARALHDLTHASVATPSLALSKLFYRESDSTIGVVLPRAWKDEFALWLFRTFKGGSTPKEWTAVELNEHHPENCLSFWGGLRQRASGRPVQYLSMEEVQAAQALDTLLSGCEGRAGADALSPYLKWLNSTSEELEGYFLGTPATAA